MLLELPPCKVLSLPNGLYWKYKSCQNHWLEINLKVKPFYIFFSCLNIDMRHKHEAGNRKLSSSLMKTRHVPCGLCALVSLWWNDIMLFKPISNGSPHQSRETTSSSVSHCGAARHNAWSSCDRIADESEP